MPVIISQNDQSKPGYSNILLVQLGDIGDVVLTTPAIRAVREACPDAHISILVRKPFGCLLTADPNIHKVVETLKVSRSLLQNFREHLLFARCLRRKHYDLVINLRTGDRGAILAYITGAPARVGLHEVNKPFWYKYLFTKLVFAPPYASLPVHPGADQSLRILRAIGISTKDTIPKLYVALKDKERAVELLAECRLVPASRWVTINPCSRWKYKEWGYEKWKEVVDWLWKNYRLPTVFIGSPEEAEAAEGIVSGSSDHAFNLAGKTTLGELSALLAMSTLHLGVDSAAPHMAAAAGTPTLTVFGPGNWRSWTIADELHQIVTAEMTCIPCNQKGCDDTEKSLCLDELSADRVCAAVNAILSALDRNRSSSIPAE